MNNELDDTMNDNELLANLLKIDKSNYGDLDLSKYNVDNDILHESMDEWSIDFKEILEFLESSNDNKNLEVYIFYQTHKPIIGGYEEFHCEWFKIVINFTVKLRTAPCTFVLYKPDTEDYSPKDAESIKLYNRWLAYIENYSKKSIEELSGGYFTYLDNE